MLCHSIALPICHVTQICSVAAFTKKKKLEKGADGITRDMNCLECVRWFAFFVVDNRPRTHLRANRVLYSMAEAFCAFFVLFFVFFLPLFF